MEKISVISFPGLGIGEFNVRNIAFTVFGRPIMWYGIIIVCGILAAFFYARFRCTRNENIKEDDLIDVTIFTVLFGVIGARLYYVFTSWGDYKADSFAATLRNVVAVWEGGLAIYGGIIAGVITLAVVCRIKKLKVTKTLDAVGPAVMLAQAMGRWGNFFNGEAYGWSEGVEKLPWRMYIKGAYRTVTENGTATRVAVDFVHPTFLYESLWNLIGFLVINALYKKKKFDGQIFLMYVTWYGCGRMFIEGLRTDSLTVGTFRISQVVAFLCFFLGLAFIVALLIVVHLRKKDAQPAAEGITEAAEVTDAADAEKETAETDGTGNGTEETEAADGGQEAPGGDAPEAAPAEEISAAEEEKPTAAEEGPADAGFGIAADYETEEEEKE